MNICSIATHRSPAMASFRPLVICCLARSAAACGSGPTLPHDDWDYLLRLSKQEVVRVETVPEILVTLYAEDARPSLSKSGKWLASLQWAERMRPMLTPRALCWLLPRRSGSPRSEGTCVSGCGAAALPRVPIRLAPSLEGRSVFRRMADASGPYRADAPKCLSHQGRAPLMRPHPRVGLTCSG